MNAVDGEVKQYFLRDAEVEILAALEENKKIPRNVDVDCVLALLEDGLIEIGPPRKDIEADPIERLRLTKVGRKTIARYA